MGENQNQPFQLSFNPSLKVDFQGSRITSDGSLVLVGIPVKVNIDSGGKPNGIPERR